MKTIFGFLFIVLTLKAVPQQSGSNVEFTGNKIQVLQATGANRQVTGKLSTGELIRTECDRGACSIAIEYKERSIKQPVGDDITKMTVYEFDFGKDGDNEIVVVNSLFETTYLFIYSYSKGIIQKLFEKEIVYYRTVIKSDYIEYYSPGGLDQVWNYYQGQFWEMNPVDKKKFLIK
jgi:hypothetical protein